MSTIQQTLSEIKARADKATPGPWRAEWHGNGVNLKVGKQPGWMIGSLGTEYIDEDCPMIPAEEIEANGELFAAARTDVPALVLALEETIDELGYLAESDDIFERRARVKALKKELIAILTSGKGAV
jgi:hypothetical protein